jgi:hypothetical protein
VETELANLIANPPPLSQTRVVTATLPSAAQNAHVPAEALRTDDSKVRADEPLACPARHCFFYFWRR